MVGYFYVSEAEYFQKSRELFVLDRAHVVWFQRSQTNAHDARAFEIDDRETHCGAHAANLVLLTFDERDGKCARADSARFARFCFYVWSVLSRSAVDHNAAFKGGEHRRRNRFLRRHDIFFLMLESRMQHAVRDAPVVREDHEAVRILVQAADRKQIGPAKRLANILLVFSGAMSDDPAGLVVCKIEIRGLRMPFRNFDDIALAYDLAEHCALSVDGYGSGGYQSVGAFSRRIAFLCQVFIDADRV